MKVYILLITRYESNFTNYTYIDSVHSSEEDTWRTIEERFYPFFEKVRKSGYDVRRIEFRGKELMFEYEKFFEDMYGSIHYEIQEWPVT